MGLVGVDVAIALTVAGAGSSSRTAASCGTCRADGSRDSDVLPERESLDALSGRNNGHRRRVDVRNELLPLLFAEMTSRYYAQMAFQVSGTAADGASVRERLQTAWRRGRFEHELATLAIRYGRFDAEAMFFGHQPKYDSTSDDEAFVCDGLAGDLREAEVPGGASPLKSAAEVLRIFRDQMRTVVEQGRLSLDPYLDFNADIAAGTIASLAVRRRPAWAGRLARAISRRHRLVSQFRDGAATVGSVDLTPDSHPNRHRPPASGTDLDVRVRLSGVQELPPWSRRGGRPKVLTGSARCCGVRG